MQPRLIRSIAFNLACAAATAVPTFAQPDQAQPDQPDQAQPNPAQPDPAQPDQPQPDQAQPIQPDQPAQPQQDAAPVTPDATPTPAPGHAHEGMGQFATPMAHGIIDSPMQEFVSHNVHEIGELSRQIDQFRAADRPEMVRMLQHMIRDHVLVSDAARNVLARRGDVSRPAPMMAVAPMPATPEEFIRQQIAHHEQMLSHTEQLLANATTPEERSIYQQSVQATRRHLNWLRSAEQGQQVALGFFGPTAPLARIAGYREERRVGAARGTRNNRNWRRTNRNNYRRGTRR
jgi:hypothetical protein